MLYVHDPVSGMLVPCKPTEFKSQGFMERFDMERWVEADPTILGEDLLIITSEYSGFDKTNERLDVLALDTDGNLVVIELKRDDSGRNVDLQALKYAAYCSSMTLDEAAEVHADYLRRKGQEATAASAKERIREFVAREDFEELSDKPRIMLVSREFRSEVTSSVQWLRTFGLDISCIKWDVFELPDGKVVVDTSVLIPQPETKDFEMRVQRKEMAERQLSPVMLATNEFFARCAALLKERTHEDYAAPRSQSYYQIPTAIGRVHFELGFHGRPRSGLGVELHFEKSKADQNAPLIEACEAHLPALEEALGEKVTVEKRWGGNWARLFIESPRVEMDNELAEWAVAKMTAMMEVMRPVLDELAAS